LLENAEGIFYHWAAPTKFSVKQSFLERTLSPLQVSVRSEKPGEEGIPLISEEIRVEAFMSHVSIKEPSMSGQIVQAGPL
jgi:hypothetical protein